MNNTSITETRTHAPKDMSNTIVQNDIGLDDLRAVDKDIISLHQDDERGASLRRESRSVLEVGQVPEEVAGDHAQKGFSDSGC